MLCPSLACSTARTHQQPKIATYGYFTWETRPWQQEKQHQLSQVSDEYRHRQSEAVSVLTPHMLPAMNLRREGSLPARQRSAAHSSCYCWLSSQTERKSAPLSSISPDMSPIENLWSDLDRRVRSGQPAPQILQELQQVIEQEWGRIPQDRIRWSIESISRWVRAVLQANGWHNRYWLWSDVIWTLWTLMW